MIRSRFFIFALFFITACGDSGKTPAGILKPQKMQVVLWDIIKADALTAEIIKNDSTKKPAEENLKMQQQIFAIHKTNMAEFFESYDYYKSNTDVFKVMLDSMIAQANRKKNNPIKPYQAQ